MDVQECSPPGNRVLAETMLIKAKAPIYRTMINDVPDCKGPVRDKWIGDLWSLDNFEWGMEM